MTGTPRPAGGAGAIVAEPTSVGTDSAPDFTTLMTALMPDLLAYFVRRVTPREDSADCLSETMIVLWRKRDTLPTTAPEQRAWAFGVAKKVLSNQRRGTIRRHALGERIREQIRHSSPSDSAAGDSDLLRGLSKTDQELVRLIVWDGFPVAEAGALLNLRPSAARMRYSRAKEKLREVTSP
ncbi:RNA polymerase sigma factor [Lacisediminihabitans sp. FW035]